MNDTTTLSATVLTSTDLRALRHADSICFDHLPDGTGRIRGILRAENSSTGFEQTHTMLVKDSRVKDYDHSEGHLGVSYTSEPVTYTGFAMSMSSKYDPVMQTVLRHLRPGTEVVLVWTRGNDNNYTRDASLHVDTLHVRAQHVKAKVADEYLIAYSVCPDNSARMVKVAR